jgi:hypothetical protein
MDAQNISVAGGIASFIPLILIGVVWGVFNASIAGRKGRNKVLFFFLSIIPVLWVFISIYLASLTNKDVLEKLGMISEE